MMRACLCLAALVASLPAREEKTELPDDLARIPAKATFAVSVRASKLWGSELGRVIRAAAGDGLDKSLKSLHGYLGHAPNEIERITVAFTGRVLYEPGEILIVRSTKKLGPTTLLPAILPGGKLQAVGGLEACVASEEAAFVGPDGKTLVRTRRDAVEAMATGRLGKPAGDVAAMARRAAEHDVTLFGAFPRITYPGLGTFPPKEMPELKTGVAWLDLGYTSKLALRLTFEDEKTAARARKLIDGGRLAAAIALSEAAEKMTWGSKPIRKVVEQVGNVLSEGHVEQKGAVVHVAFDVKVDRETADAAIKEWFNRPWDNLERLGLALHSYTYRHKDLLPPAATYDKDGKPLLSWRVALLPYLKEEKLYKEFKLDEPWDSPHNKKLIHRMPKAFASPGVKPSVPGGTFYKVIHGKGAAFEGKDGLRLDDVRGERLLNRNRILIVETAKDVPWTKPEDVAFDPDGKPPTLGGVREGGFYACLAELESVRFVPATLRPEALKAMILRTGRTTPADRE